MLEKIDVDYADSTALIETILNAMDHGVLLVDEHQKVRAANPPFMKFFEPLLVDSFVRFMFLTNKMDLDRLQRSR